MGKHHSQLARWRAYRGMKQRQVVERLAAIQAKNPGEKFPTTEASLSRVENGSQNFSMNLLSALAEIYEVEQPGDLLTINPFAGTLKVIRAMEGLSETQRDAAMKVIEAMFPPADKPAPDESDGDRNREAGPSQP